MSDQFVQCIDSRQTLQANFPSSLDVSSMANGPPNQTKVRNDNSQELLVLNQNIKHVPIIKNFTKVTDFDALPERVVFKAIKPRNLT